MLHKLFSLLVPLSVVEIAPGIEMVSIITKESAEKLGVALGK
ncbi:MULTISPECIES: hypothetical protein [Microcystis]|nr:MULTISPECIES: hypothetical protein [Microcystis]BCU14508.1 hypothetical protein MAN88_50720 [Microcystis aeruginosa]